MGTGVGSESNQLIVINTDGERSIDDGNDRGTRAFTSHTARHGAGEFKICWCSVAPAIDDKFARELDRRARQAVCDDRGFQRDNRSLRLKGFLDFGMNVKGSVHAKFRREAASGRW